MKEIAAKAAMIDAQIMRISAINKASSISAGTTGTGTSEAATTIQGFTVPPDHAHHAAKSKAPMAFGIHPQNHSVYPAWCGIDALNLRNHPCTRLSFDSLKRDGTATATRTQTGKFIARVKSISTALRRAL